MNDEERKLLPPFKTTIPATGAALEDLRGWREPNHAYVLMEARKRDARSGNIHTGIITLTVEHRPEQLHKVDHYERKGGKVIHYGNFPSVNSPSLERVKLYKLHNPHIGSNPWDLMAGILNHKMGMTKAQDERLQGLELALEKERAALKDAHKQLAEVKKPKAA